MYMKQNIAALKMEMHFRTTIHALFFIKNGALEGLVSHFGGLHSRFLVVP